ncbi:hypothetical protein Tco_0390600 [Tanacetum coccineum]
MNEFATNDKANYYSGITSITVNGKNAYELKGKFLDDLHNNAFSGAYGVDVVKHIEYFLKTVDPIDLPNVNHDRLRVVVFPISLAGNARKWFDEIKGSITSWVDLTVIFFRKYYPSSCTGSITTTMIKWDPTNPKFEYCDNTELTNEKGSDLEDECSSDVDETTKIFKIETDIFDYKAPLCTKLNEFNYLLKIDPELFTYDVEGIKTYDDYMNKFDEELAEPWGMMEYLTKLVIIFANLFVSKMGKLNGPLAIQMMMDFAMVENYREWFELALWHIFKIMSVNDHECPPVTNWRNYIRGPYANYYSNILDIKDHEDEKIHELCEDASQELPVCNIRKFKMIKYSFGDDEKYVAIKKDEYDDLTSTSKDACRAYQEIFRMMDEGWMVTRDE